MAPGIEGNLLWNDPNMKDRTFFFSCFQGVVNNVVSKPMTTHFLANCGTQEGCGWLSPSSFVRFLHATSIMYSLLHMFELKEWTAHQSTNPWKILRLSGQRKQCHRNHWTIAKFIHQLRFIFHRAQRTHKNAPFNPPKPDPTTTHNPTR